MRQIRIPATFMRGGTSKGLVFHARDLPADPAERDRLILAAMGSPDPYGRQLDGMGGGISSLSKICIVGPASHPDADVDYTFGQVAVDRATVDYAGNCGNMSSAVGPFAVDEGLVSMPADGEAAVRIHNTNTGKLIVSRFQVQDGEAATRGDFALDGVAGTAAPIRLEFLDPGGAKTGRLLPTGTAIDHLELDGRKVQVSLIDAANPFVFIAAESLGMSATELPRDIQSNGALMEQLERLRRAGSVMMGIARDAQEAERIVSVPKIAMLARPADSRLLSGATLAAGQAQILARAISVGQAHNAIPLTGALCLAAACRVAGSVAQRLLAPEARDRITIGHPSGTIDVDAQVRPGSDPVTIEQATVYRSARRLFKGVVYTPQRTA